MNQTFHFINGLYKMENGKGSTRHLNEEGQSGLRRAIFSQQLKLSGGQLCAFFLPLSFWVIFSLKLSYYLPLQHF